MLAEVRTAHARQQGVAAGTVLQGPWQAPGQAKQSEKKVAPREAPMDRQQGMEACKGMPEQAMLEERAHGDFQQMGKARQT